MVGTAILTIQIESYKARKGLLRKNAQNHMRCRYVRAMYVNSGVPKFR